MVMPKNYEVSSRTRKDLLADWKITEKIYSRAGRLLLIANPGAMYNKDIQNV